MTTGSITAAASSVAGWARAPGLALCLAVTGCSSLLPPANPQAAVYALASPARPPLARIVLTTASTPAMVPAVVALNPAAPVLVVHVSQAAAGFDSARIIYTQQPNRLQAFARHEWVDAPARMLAPLIVTALERSGSFSAVVLAPSAASGGLQLETQLLRLQQEFDTPPSQVRLVLRAQLIHTVSRQVLATRDFEQVASSGSEDAPGGVAAAQVAVNAVLADLAAWCQSVVPPRR